MKMAVSPTVQSLARRDVLTGLALSPFLGLMDIRVVAAATSGFDYYVGPNGLPTNAGTSASPWSIDQLTTRTEIAGKRIGLLDGTYVVPATYSDNWGGNSNAHGIHITQAGTSAAPTSIEAVNPGAVTLSAASAVNFSIVTIDAPYVRIYGLVFNSKTFPAIRLWGNYSTIDTCDFLPIYAGASGDNVGAIYLKQRGDAPVQSPLIRNCAFRGVYNSGSNYTLNANAIMGFSVQNAIIEYCTATNCYSLFRPKYDWYGYTVRYNYIYNVGNFIQHLCVPSTYAGRVRIHNNLAIGFSGGYLYESTEKAADADIYNNTIIIPPMSGPGAAIRWWKMFGEAANTGAFYNNIVSFRSAPVSGQYIHDFGGLQGVGYAQQFKVMDYNAYPNMNSAYFNVCNGDLYTPDASWNTISAWRAASGFDVNSIQVDPGFVDPLGGTPSSFQLNAASPCRGAGRVGGISTGAAIDMGCWSQGVTAIGANLTAVAKPAPIAPTLNGVL